MRSTTCLVELEVGSAGGGFSGTSGEGIVNVHCCGLKTSEI